MFSHELEDPSVSSSNLPKGSSIAKFVRRFAAMLYTPEGKVLTDRVWEETLTELDFAGVRTILESMKP